MCIYICLILYEDIIYLVSFIEYVVEYCAHFFDIMKKRKRILARLDSLNCPNDKGLSSVVSILVSILTQSDIYYNNY